MATLEVGRSGEVVISSGGRGRRRFSASCPISTGSGSPRKAPWRWVAHGSARRHGGAVPARPAEDHRAEHRAAYDRLADALEDAIGLPRLLRLLGI